MTKEELCALAIDAMKMAYVPYSGYTVGDSSDFDGKSFYGLQYRERIVYTDGMRGKNGYF